MRLAGTVCGAVILVLAAPASSQPGALPDAYVTPPSDGRIIPQPKTVRWLDRPFEFAAGARIVVGDAAQPEDLYAVRELNEELIAWGSPPLEVVEASAVAGDLPQGGLVLIGEAALNPLVAAHLARDGLRLDSQDPGPEGYVLRVAPGLLLAAGVDRRGTFYAIQTLRQLIRSDGGRLISPGVEIRDWPDHPIRAVHVVLDGYSHVFHTALIDRIFSRYKFNVLIAESEYVQWESAPTIWHPEGATKAQAAAVVAAAREHLMEPVPLIQTLGHSGWLFHNDQNLDLLEMPAEVAPARFAYNPLNPRVYQVILPIFDEAIALFRPRFLHIGHDEVRNVVPFPWSEDGRRLGFGELFVRDTLRLYEHLKSRGVGTMMWGDVLLTSDYAPELSRLPRDIMMVDWQYHGAARFPSLERFRAWGFPVLAATWFRHENIASLAYEARRAGAAGMVRTTWTGYFGNRTALSQYPQIASYLAAGDHFWTADRPEPRLSPVEAAGRFRSDWREQRDLPRTVAGRPLNLRPVATRSHVDDGAGWLEKGSGYDLRNLPTGPQRFGGVLFDVIDPDANGGRSVVMLRGVRHPTRGMPARVTLPVRRRAVELCVLHALPYPETRFGETVGVYRIHFEDGEAAEIPVQYRRNIGTWLDDPASIEHEIAWSGRTRAGVDVRLSLLCWVSPRPERMIVTIDLESGASEGGPVIFAITALDEPRRSAGRR
ncbi:MAG: beta-N-acetylhexosaminidase [Armatimonadetes bacterium]|nr:beta-N-acetylhexosaminidase [Armatimonadota bacterium]